MVHQLKNKRAAYAQYYQVYAALNTKRYPKCRQSFFYLFETELNLLLAFIYKCNIF